eukprot:3079674-Pleurochrysis_carterae.AAC.1
MNEVLLKHGQKWSFAEKKGQRDNRPPGHESRTLRTLCGLLRQLLCVRYGAADGDDDEAALHDLGDAPTQHIDPAPTAQAALAAQQQKATGRKRKPLTAVTPGSTSASPSSHRRPPPLPPPSNPLPPPASAAPSSAPTPPSATNDDEFDLGGDEEDADFAAYDADGDDVDDFLPLASAECSASDLKSAAKVWLAVIELNEILHTPFDDASRARRVEVGAASQAKGMAWVLAMRAHSGISVAFNYMHLSSAHLGELIA